MHFPRIPPKLITYRDFKKLDNERFMSSLQPVLLDPRTDYNIHNPELFFSLMSKSA